MKNLSGFQTVHPEKVREFVGEDLPQDGQPVKTNESRFVRCKFCGAINDTELRPKGDGYSGNISYVAISGTNLKDPTIGGAGCNFCGSSEYY